MFRFLCIALLFVAGLAADVDINDRGIAAVAANRALKQDGGLAMTTTKKKSPSTKKKSPSPKKKSPSTKKKSPSTKKKSPGKKSPFKSPAKKPPSPKSPAKKPPSPKSPAKPAAGGKKHVIAVGSGAGFSFSPRDSKGIKVGDSVCFKSESSGHNVLFMDAPDGVKLAAISNTAMQNADIGYQYCFTVTKSGMYNYICGPHATSANMKGTLSVD